MAHARRVCRHGVAGGCDDGLRRRARRPDRHPGGTRPRRRTGRRARLRGEPPGARGARGHRPPPGTAAKVVAPVTVVAPGARPTAPLHLRLVATVALALSLALCHVPLRRRIAVVRQARRLPYVSARRLDALYTATTAAVPLWWPGRVACMEISLATVIAAALTGRRARWVLGARFRPDAAHAWAEVPGHAVGRDIGDAVDRPWTAVMRVP
ncbi:lasso peptide biosynthesis B2 protein [Streptomyces fradiae ATCC 10745 = DSM 40063]|nr:lasso peptide biosynthesis B2 protein [Streptomyces fradiae ATCC 10745 = DSM 40063]